jgi:hypothetical protein
MVLRTIAFVLFGLALCMGVYQGWRYPMSTMFYGSGGGQTWLQRLVGPDLWSAAFVPLLTLPAWSLPAFIGVVFMIAAAMRPGRG